MLEHRLMNMCAGTTGIALQAGARGSAHLQSTLFDTHRWSPVVEWSGNISGIRYTRNIFSRHKVAKTESELMKMGARQMP